MQRNQAERLHQEREEHSGYAYPPNCSLTMQSEIVAFSPERMEITVNTPVQEAFTNPAGSMQGGFVTAAFDNAFGPLCLMVTGGFASTTIDIYTNYHRPIFPGDVLSVTASVVYKGKRAVQMAARGYNREGKLIATATANYILLNPQNQK